MEEVQDRHMKKRVAVWRELNLHKWTLDISIVSTSVVRSSHPAGGCALRPSSVDESRRYEVQVGS